MLLFAGSTAFRPAGKTAGCRCGAACACRCCPHDAGAADARSAVSGAESPHDVKPHGGSECVDDFCVLRHRGESAPPSEVPLTTRLRVREAVFALPALLPHPVLEGRLDVSAPLLPVSHVPTPEVPPPRAAV